MRICSASDAMTLMIAWFVVHALEPTSAVSVTIDAHPNGDKPVPSGTKIRFRCAAARMKLPPTFGLLRQRLKQQQAHLVEEVTESIVTEADGDLLVKEFQLTLTPEDNGATFFCELVSSGALINVARSNGQYYNVTYAPMQVLVTAFPVGSVAESVSKIFTCQLNGSGSNPPSELQWTQLDSAGARLPLNEVLISATEQLVGRYGSAVARSNLTVTAVRAINGRRFECNAVYLGKKTLLRSEEILEVKFPPNNVRLIAQPMNGVREASRLELTCVTSTCHPPAVIRWFEMPPTTDTSPNTERKWSRRSEITDLAQLDSNPGEFGGTKVSSKLIVAKTYRSDQNTVYRCQVEHPGMAKPSITEHVLQILYPPSVQVVTLPLEPVVGQNVILFCQTSGGSSQSGFIYSWFVGSRPQLIRATNTEENGTTGERGSGGQLKLLPQPPFEKMLRLIGENDAHLNLSQVRLSQRGWYACEVASAGGESRAFFLLDLFYPPIANRRTQSKLMAHVGESVSFLLYLDANPPWTEATWFQVMKSDPSQPLLTMGTHSRHQEAFYGAGHPSLPYGNYYPYDVRFISSNHVNVRTRRETRSPVGHGERGRLHITAGRGPTNGRDNLTFSLRFDPVHLEDFGHYICQVRHHLGVKDFDFQLMQKSGFEGIVLSSISVSQRDATTLVRFRPPMNPVYTRIMLRVCRRDAFHTTASSPNPKSSSDARFFLPRTVNMLYPQSDPLQFEQSESYTDVKDSSSRLKPGCDDYLVAKPLSGQTEIRLADAPTMYNFRLLVFQGSRLIQETPAVYWQPDAATGETSLGIPMTALAVAGGCVLFLIILILAGVLFVYCGRRRKSALQSNPSGFKSKHFASASPHKRCIGSGDSEFHRSRAGGLGCELRSDLGSMRSYQASEMEAIPLVQQMSIQSGRNFDNDRSGIPNSRSPLHLPRNLEGDYDSLMRSQNSAPSNLATGMGMLSNRMMAEAYLAAARAASAAVAASVISGSTDLYAPSTQMTGDLAPSPVHETNDGDKQQLNTSQQSSVAAEAASASPGGYMEHTTDGAKSGRRGSNVGSTVNSAKMNMGRRYEERHSSQLLIPSSTRGSRSSIQVGSPWRSASGASLTSQASLEAAARAAAAAAVASVMQHMSTSFMMHHAASSSNLNTHPYFAPRPASRAASVAGKTGMESGDGESLHSAAFEPRYTPNPCSTAGEVTPTSSLSPLDPSLLMASGTNQLTVPVIQRQSPMNRLPGQMHQADIPHGFRQAIGAKPSGHNVMSRMDQPGVHRPQVHGAGSREGVTQRIVPNRAPNYPFPHGGQTGFMYSQPVTIFHPTQQGFLPVHTQFSGILPGFNPSSNQPHHHHQQQQHQASHQSHLSFNETASSSRSSQAETHSSKSDTLTAEPGVAASPRLISTRNRHLEQLDVVAPPDLKLNGISPAARDYVHNPASIVHEDNFAHREVGVGDHCFGDPNKALNNLEYGLTTPKVVRKIATELTTDASDEADTLERPLHSTGACCRDNIPTAEANQSTINHPSEQVERSREEGQIPLQNIPTPPLRKSPVGASLHTIGNGRKLSDDDEEEEHFTANHPMLSVSKCEGRHVPHRMQPRLGVHSPRRTGKPYEEVKYNSHEEERSPPIMKSSQMELGARVATKPTDASTHPFLSTLPNGNGCS